MIRVALLNTGTELLLGDVQDAHLAFIAREIFPLGLRIEERRTVPDSEAIRQTLAELLPRYEIVFVTGGLGPTTDDITREVVAALLGLELQRSSELLASLRQRLQVRGIKWTTGIARQADVPTGAEVLPNQNGSAPGLYLRANINPPNPSPHLFLLPGPPRELQPMFRAFAMPVLRSIVPDSAVVERRTYKIADMGESLVEEAIGDRVLAIPGVELGYCARPGEVDVRIVGKTKAIEQADAVIRSTLGSSIFSSADETLEEVIVKRLMQLNRTLAVAESCTGGSLANRITNVPGASEVFLAGYVCYSNQAKINMLNIDPGLIEKHGAVSEEVARALAEHARACARSDYALATTGVAGPGGGSPEKPVGTVYIALGASDETIDKKFFFPTDRETFKQIATQVALELLRRRVRER
jgi:competence/damage-inducible protein CinA-like protein